MVVRQILDLNVEVRALVGQQAGRQKRRFFCIYGLPGGIYLTLVNLQRPGTIVNL
jgi:hypothetical protein